MTYEEHRCWETPYTAAERKWGSDHWRTYKAMGDDRKVTCLRRDGHKGAHRWTPNDEFKIVFAPQAAD